MLCGAKDNANRSLRSALGELVVEEQRARAPRRVRYALEGLEARRKISSLSFVEVVQADACPSM